MLLLLPRLDGGNNSIIICLYLQVTSKLLITSYESIASMDFVFTIRLTFSPPKASKIICVRRNSQWRNQHSVVSQFFFYPSRLLFQFNSLVRQFHQSLVEYLCLAEWVKTGVLGKWTVVSSLWFKMSRK